MTEQVQDSKGPDASEDVSVLVKKAIKNSASVVKNKVVDLFVNEEIDKRVKSLHSAYVKLKELRNAVNKIKPDNVNYDEEGQVTSQSYSKAKVDELKKSKERVVKLERAIDAAIANEENAFNKLDEVMKKC